MTIALFSRETATQG